MIGFGWIAPLLGIINKALGFLPSKDERLGEAEADLKQAKEAQDAQKRMDAVPDSSSDDTDRSLRDGSF